MATAKRAVRKAGGKTSPKKLTEAARHLEILTLRRAGGTYRSIAERFGITRQAAYKNVKRELDEVRRESRESAQEILELDLDRLDAMFLGLWNAATTGHLGAVDRAVRIIERRSKMAGNENRGGAVPVNVNLGVGVQITAMGIMDMANLSDDPEEFMVRYHRRLKERYGDRIPDIVEEGQVLGAPKEDGPSKKKSGISTAMAVGGPSTAT